MFENLKAQLANASFKDGHAKSRASGLVSKCADELKVFGVDVTQADSASSATVGGALSVLRAQVAAASFTSTYAKWSALGRVDQLSNELGACGVAVTS